MSNSTSSSQKMLGIRVILLDESITIIQAQRQAVGRIVFNEIIKQLNILESDYFGLEYTEGSTGTTYWLNLDKKLSRQVGLNLNEPVLKFCVKFYTPDPSLLEEEFTRYLFSLQIKQDLINGDLVCNDNTAALLISYLVQAECGDWNEDDYPDPSYLKTYKFVANQDSEMEERIRDNHKKHVGQSPSDADLHLLETARRTEFYGLKFQQVKDESGVLPNLRMTSSCNGILVYQNNIKLSHYSWSKIRKMSFKRKKFLIKLYKDNFFGPETSQNQPSESIIEYIFPNRNSCKSYWKKCIEIYSFFKLNINEEKVKSRSKSLLSARGSSFRYTGRTQKEMISFLRDNFMKRSNGAAKRTEMDKSFGRSSSMRSATVSHHHFEDNNSVATGHHSHSNVSTSYSSPGNIQKSTTSRNDSDSPDDEEEDETLSPTGTLSPVPVSPDHHPSTSDQRLPDPDWFFYALRELLNTQRNITNQLMNLDDTVMINLSTQLLKLLESNLESIPRQIWELTNGINLVRLLLKYFQTNNATYLISLTSLTLDNSTESNYNKLSLVYYFIYLHGEFCKIILSYSNFNTNSNLLVQLINQLIKILEPLTLKCNDLTPVFENQLKLIEIMTEVNGITENMELGDLVRFGILMKFNSKLGLENRIFILTTNYLLYGSRVSSAVGFRLHGLLPLVTLKLESSNQNELPNSFSISTGGKILLLSAFSEKSKEAWMADMDITIRRAEPLRSTLTSNGVGSIPCNLNDIAAKPLSNYRLNNMLHVCWHRNLTISFKQICHVTKYTISGYLLRKFKNSAGWQKLFVTFNHVCLFFYKSHEDKTPLATLPLLGYKIQVPTPEDGITKDFVFKITFKNHIYYFRTESPFTFKRWIYVLTQATNCI